MRFIRTAVEGAFIVEADPAEDSRGAFARLYCPDEFQAAGITGFTPVQVNLSRNRAARTLRGMHYQNPPHAEAKLVHVTQGAIHDVALDLRPQSPSYRRWAAVRLDAASLRAFYIPEGCAHGFLTLEPDTDVLYHMGRMFEPGHGEGLRWNDPAFGIDWPDEPAVISERDAEYPDFSADTGDPCD